MPGNILEGIINLKAPNAEAVTTKVSKAVEKTADSFNKLPTAPLEKVAEAAKTTVGDLTKVAPVVEQISKSISSIPSAPVSLDFSAQFEAARAKVSQSVDKMVADALRVPEAIEQIGVEAKQVQGPISQLAKQLERFGGGVRPFNNVVQGFNGFKKSATEATTALKPLARGSDQANLALVNLGRVVQDAPFGFLGIANNLNPLVESFQRTGKAAGGFGGALKAMGKSLIGPGGIGLAISLVSSALVLFGDKLFGKSKEAKALQEAIDQLAGSFAKEAVQLTTIVGLIKNQNTSNGDRAKALQFVNQEYGKYLKNLGIEKVDVNNLTQAYDALIDNLLRQAVVKGLQEEIAASVEKTAKQIIALQVEQQKEQSKTTKVVVTDAQKQEDARKRAIAGAQAFAKGARDGFIAQTEFNLAQKEAIKENTSYEARINSLKKALTGELAPLLNLTDKWQDLGLTINDTGKKGDNVLAKTIQLAKQLAAFLDKNTQFAVSFEVDPNQSDAQQLQSARDFIDKARRFINDQTPEFSFKPIVLTDFELKFNRRVISNIRDQAGIEATKTYKEVKKAFEDNIKQLAENNPIVVETEAKLRFAKAQQAELFSTIGIQVEGINAPLSLLSEMDKKAVNLAKTFSDILAPAVGDFIGAIAQGENPIVAFFNTVKQAILQVIQKLISAAITAAIFNAILGAKGGGFGTLFKGFAGFRAQGGPVSMGRSYIVGEKGPELFVPSTAGRIVSNNAIGRNNSQAFSMPPAFELSATNVLRGKDIVQVFSLQQAYERRNT